MQITTINDVRDWISRTFSETLTGQEVDRVTDQLWSEARIDGLEPGQDWAEWLDAIDGDAVYQFAAGVADQITPDNEPECDLDDDDDETVSLRDWNNEDPITYLWICGVGCPAGKDLFHNVDTDVDEDYCDFAELGLLDRLWGLVGTVDENGTWCWDGEGYVTDSRGSQLYNVKARR